MPRIGLLADSHGRAAVTRRAVAVLAEQGASMLLYLGDVGHTGVIDALVVEPQTTGPVGETRLVFGNIDKDVEALRRYAVSVGVAVDHPMGRLDLGGRRLVYTHGDDGVSMRRAIEQKVDYLCHGHTHKARDVRVDATRVINPGALYQASQYTVAVLDTDVNGVTFYPVDRV